MKAAESGLEIGALVANGRYELRGCTLEGPAYVDYRAFDREVEVEVALWWMDPILFAAEAAGSAFEAAAREMRGVIHPSLRRLFDVGRDRDSLYLTSQAGSPDGIGQRLGSGRGATDEDLVRYASALADALEAVHAAGVVHGRLVPSDLVEVAGHVKVSGAGLYGALDRAVAAQRWASWRRYLAPEVLVRGALDRAADVYSMAAILVELASGISRPDLGEAMAALESERPALAGALRPALASEPRRRPGRPGELFDGVRRGLAGQGLPPVAPGLPPERSAVAWSDAAEPGGPAPPSDAIAERSAAWSSTGAISDGAPTGADPAALRSSSAGSPAARPVVAAAGSIASGPRRPEPPVRTPPVGGARPGSRAAADAPRESSPMRAVEDGWELDDVVLPRVPARERIGVGSEARIDPPGGVRGEGVGGRPDQPAAEPDPGQQTIEESSPLFLHPSAAPSSPLFGPNQPTLTDQRAPRGAPPPAAPASGSPERTPVAALGSTRQRSAAAAGTSSSTLERTRGTLPPAIPTGRQRATLPPGAMAPRTTVESAVPPPPTPRSPASRSPNGPPAIPPPIPSSGRGAPPVVSARPSLDRGPPPAEPPSEPAGAGLVVPLLSRRDPTQTHARPTPIIPAIDRPEMQPILRPLSSLRPSAPAGSLGRYAPPRSAEREAYSPPPRRRAQLLAIGIATGVVFAAVALVLVLRGGTRDEGAAAPARPPVSEPRPAPREPTAPEPAPTSPCPDGMALVAGDREGGARARFCVDRHEAPGPGAPPRLGLSFEQAASACEERGARLCRPAEWEAGCRGPDRSSFPYGARYIDKRCNARGREIAASGSFPECQSAAGAFDMSGNAAEWDAEGNVRGASATDGTRGRCSELRRRGGPRASARDRADVGFRCCADPLAKVTPSR